MKNVCKIISIILVFSILFALPVSAEEISPYASSFFGSHTAYLWKTSSTSFEVCFNVTAVGTMSQLGVNYIEIQRSTDGVNWEEDIKTYSSANYSNLIANNTVYHSGYVTYSNMQSSYQYRAYIEFYAKNSSGNRAYSGAYAYF